MKKKIVLSFLLSLSLTLPLFSQSGEDTPISFSSFQGGLNTKTNPLLLNESQSPDCQNVYFDETDLLSKRNGYTIYCTLPATGTVLSSFEYTRTSGEKWLLVQISSSIYGSKDNGLTWTMIVSNLSLINPCNYTQHIDQAWITNGFNDVLAFNGSSTTAYGFVPKGKYITTHFGQLFIANTPENNSAVYFNDAFYGPTNPLGWFSENSFIFGKDDGDKITGIISDKGNLIVFKSNSTWGILGFGRDMSLYKYSNTYGSVSQQSIKPYKTDLLFLSKLGLCVFNNGNIKQIDRAVESITKNSVITNGTVIKKEWIQTEDQDFLQGTISTVTFGGGVIQLPLSETRRGDNKFSEPANGILSDGYEYSSAGTLNSTAAFVVTGWIGIPHNNADTYVLSNIQVNLRRGGNVTKSSVTIELRNALDVVIDKQTKYFENISVGSWFTFFDTSSVNVLSTSMNADTSLRVVIYRHQSGSYADGADGSGLDLMYHQLAVENRSILTYEYTETYRLDVNVDSAISAYAAEGWTIYRTEIIPTIPSSIGNVNRHLIFQRPTSFSDPTNIYYKRLALQWQYQTTISSWGAYVSQKFDAGSKINQWKYFYTSDNGGTSYYVRYATFTTSSVFDNFTSSWIPINNGSIIAATTSQRYIQWKARLDTPYSKVFAVTLQYYEGASDYQDCSSAFFNNRYYLSFSTIGVTNNINIVIDNNAVYTLWDMPVGVFIPYNTLLLFSKNNDTNLYQILQGHNDNGVAINGYWKSKYFDMGSNQDKKINKIGITAKGSGNLIVGYKANYDTAFSTITIPLTSSETNYVYNLPESINRAQYWQILLQNNTGGGWFDIIRCDVYFIGYPLRAR